MTLDWVLTESYFTTLGVVIFQRQPRAECGRRDAQHRDDVAPETSQTPITEE
jgi:hypothetical protein